MPGGKKGGAGLDVPAALSRIEGAKMDCSIGRGRYPTPPGPRSRPLPRTARGGRLSHARHPTPPSFAADAPSNSRWDGVPGILYLPSHTNTYVPLPPPPGKSPAAAPPASSGLATVPMMPPGLQGLPPGLQGIFNVRGGGGGEGHLDKPNQRPFFLHLYPNLWPGEEGREHAACPASFRRGPPPPAPPCR